MVVVLADEVSVVVFYIFEASEVVEGEVGGNSAGIGGGADSDQPVVGHGDQVFTGEFGA